MQIKLDEAIGLAVLVIFLTVVLILLGFAMGSCVHNTNVYPVPSPSG